MTKKLNTTPLEETEQQAFVIWLDSQISKGADIIYSAIPNSTFTTSWNQKRLNKAMGVCPGLPDLFIITANHNLLYIEMKRQKGSTTSPEQKEWIADINDCDNAQAFICKGFAEAKIVIECFI